MTSEKIKLLNSEVCHVFLQTGLKLPQANEVRKWHEGEMRLTINPGAGKKYHPFYDESKPLVINERFAVNSQGVVDCEFWIKDIGEPITLKIEFARDTRLAPIFIPPLRHKALYIREVGMIWKRKVYRFPVHNYLKPHGWGKDDGYVPSLTLRSGSGTLRHLEELGFAKEAREKNLSNIRSMVPWCCNNKVKPFNSTNHIDLPEYKDLPRFLKFRHSQDNAFTWSAIYAGLDIGVRAVKTACEKACCCLIRCGNCSGVNSFRSLGDYAESFSTMGERAKWSKTDIKEGLKVGEIFHEDGEFGRQIIQGPNSLKLTRVDELSSPWKDAIEKGMLPDYAIDNEDLQDVIKDGRLFQVVNSKLLEGVGHGGKYSRYVNLRIRKQKWYVIQADCLFFWSKKRHPQYAFVPVLIRLENKNDQKNDKNDKDNDDSQTFWSPPEPGSFYHDEDGQWQPEGEHAMSWFLAKIHFRCADWQVYSVGTHFARAHAMSEVFGTSMYRNLPSAHPLYRILQPHFQGIIAVNAQAREHLVSAGFNVFATFMSAGDDLQTLLQNCCKDLLKYKHLVIPKDFEDRGLMDLPQYFYRDDSIKLWNILHEYVTDMINLSYPRDEDVKLDYELQNFINEIVEYGVSNFAEDGDFPNYLEDKEELITYITAMIYNVSCFHTGVNFQINKYLAYIPNAPPAIVLPPPAQNDEVTMKTIMKSLPKRDMAVVVMAATEMLGKFSPIERFYSQTKASGRKGYFGENMAVSVKQEEKIAKMTSAMDDLTAEIWNRNAEMEKEHGKQNQFKHFLAYNVLSPDNVPLTTEV